MGFKHTKVEYNFRTETDESYDYLRLPYEECGGRKVLFVLDYVPSDDLASGRLLSGTTGDLLGQLVNFTKKLYAKGLKDFSWFAVNYNCFRTIGKTPEYVAQAKEEFNERLKMIICRYKPDVVITFGRDPTNALIPHKIQLSNGKHSPWLGLNVPVEVKHRKQVHQTLVCSNISLNTIVTGDSGPAGIIGYMMRCLANGLQGNKYLVDSEKLEAHKSIIVDSRKKFDRLLSEIKEAEVVSIDTETKNLARITNRLLTVQFATTQDRGYMIPFYHKDTPFGRKELDYIRDELRGYFEGDNQNRYHIYANAQFDLSVLRNQLELDHYANDLWDIFGAAFAIDENLKFLDVAIGEYYYSLGNLSVQHGFEGYLTAEFGKQNRGNIENTDLTPAFVKYSTLDTVVPLAIHEQQKRQAADIGYKAYERVVTKEISDTIHSFNIMEYTGSGLDVPYLFHLRSAGSPIEQVIREMQGKLLNTPAAKKASRILGKQNGVPQKLLMESLGASSRAILPSTSSLLKLNKAEHKQLFFFRCLGLSPLSVGKDGKTGKIDKGFQSHYKDVPEVAQYTELEKAKKLKNAYVKSFIQMLGESEDLKKDHRIRPRYNYLKVVTHRTSASDPNLQQVPSRSELGKHIKRLFIARKGTLYIKVDYRVHEVRGWGLISFDKAVAELFEGCKKLRDAYRQHPTSELRKRLKAEADVHIMNASYFFGVKIEDVTKALRNDVKGVIFGLIYQMSIKSLAETLGRTVEFTEELVNNFRKRFPNGMNWIEDIKKFARSHLYVEAPIGIRRNLWGYILPDTLEQARSIKNRLDRQAVNSPIQGMCSKFMMNGIRILDKKLHRLRKKGREVMLWINNSVHDSLENEAGYGDFILGLKIVEEALTTDVRREVLKRCGFDFVVDVEIDFEIGAALSQCDAWDFSVHSLERLVMDSLLMQRNELGHKVKVQRAHDLIFSKVDEDGPKWMKQQVKNLDYKFDLTEKQFIKEHFEEAAEMEATANKMLKGLDQESEDQEVKDTVKKAKGMLKDAQKIKAYAEKLEGYRVTYAKPD